MPTGQNGEKSTKVEFFHGECHGWEDYDEVNVRHHTTGAYLTFHHSYLVGDPNREYCIAGGGRCYPISEVWDQLLRAVKCSLCYKQLVSEEAYEAHYQDKHA